MAKVDVKIVLIGDSIRGGYMRRVRELVGGRADVVWPDANCGNSMLIREHLREWAIDHNPDVVHFNAGIHDLGWMDGETVPRFTVSAYVRNLRIIVDRLQQATKARLIFATATPFPVPLGDTPPETCTPAPVVERYNRAAVKLMKPRGVAINDLHAAVMNAGILDCMGDDKLHMSDHGNEVLAQQVTRALLRA